MTGSLFDKVTFEVTGDDIAEGTSDCDTCPIALAFRRSMPMATNIDVCGDEIAFHFGGRSYRGRSEDVGTFTAIFDANGPVDARSFTVSFEDVGPAEPVADLDTMCTLPVEKGTE